MHLLVQVAGQEAEPLARLDRRPRQDDARDLALHQGRDRHRHREVRLPRPRGPDRDDQVVPAHGLDVALLVERLRGDLASCARAPGWRRAKTLLTSAPGSSASDAQGRRGRRRRRTGSPAPEPGQQLLARCALRARTCRSSPRRVIVVAAGGDADVELRLEQAQVLVVPAEQGEEVDIGGELRRWVVGSATRRALGLRHNPSGITRAGPCQFPGAPRQSLVHGAIRRGLGHDGARRLPSSRSCSGPTGAGASVSGQVPFWVLGNAMTSRMDSCRRPGWRRAGPGRRRCRPWAARRTRAPPGGSRTRARPSPSRCRSGRRPAPGRARWWMRIEPPAALLAVQHEIVGLGARAARDRTRAAGGPRRGAR